MRTRSDCWPSTTPRTQLGRKQQPVPALRRCPSRAAPAESPRRLTAMARKFQGTIKLDARDSTPDWEPFHQPVAPAGAPNVLYIVLDDVGFSAMQPWGGLIETPNI